MFKFKSLLTAAATVAALAVSSAPIQALTLTTGDVLNITGQSTFSLDPIATTDTIDFLTWQVESDSSGGFYDEYVVGSETLDDVSSIYMEHVSGIDYLGTSDNPLMTFSGGVTLVADNPFDVSRVAAGFFGITYTFSPFSGEFVGASGDVLASGLFTAQQFIGQDGTYSMTLIVSDSVPVPEPSAAALLALGIVGLVLGRRLSRRA